MTDITKGTYSTDTYYSSGTNFDFIIMVIPALYFVSLLITLIHSAAVPPIDSAAVLESDAASIVSYIPAEPLSVSVSGTGLDRWFTSIFPASSGVTTITAPWAADSTTELAPPPTSTDTPAPPPPPPTTTPTPTTRPQSACLSENNKIPLHTSAVSIDRKTPRIPNIKLAQEVFAVKQSVQLELGQGFINQDVGIPVSVTSITFNPNPVPSSGAASETFIAPGITTIIPIPTASTVIRLGSPSVVTSTSTVTRVLTGSGVESTVVETATSSFLVTPQITVDAGGGAIGTIPTSVSQPGAIIPVFNTNPIPPPGATALTFSGTGGFLTVVPIPTVSSTVIKLGAAGGGGSIELGLGGIIIGTLPAGISEVGGLSPVPVPGPGGPPEDPEPSPTTSESLPSSSSASTTTSAASSSASCSAPAVTATSCGTDCDSDSEFEEDVSASTPTSSTSKRRGWGITKRGGARSTSLPQNCLTKGVDFFSKK
ncbi:hypothetical protein B0H13DRAFT_2304347 [Mycena leptocephala]|nr:hypothetical protein B0H13DRAFT_2304347 [Mycena leptocephala]